MAVQSTKTDKYDKLTALPEDCLEIILSFVPGTNSQLACKAFKKADEAAKRMFWQQLIDAQKHGQFIHNPLLNRRIETANQFYEKLLKLPENKINELNISASKLLDVIYRDVLGDLKGRGGMRYYTWKRDESYSGPKNRFDLEFYRNFPLIEGDPVGVHYPSPTNLREALHAEKMSLRWDMQILKMQTRYIATIIPHMVSAFPKSALFALAGVITFRADIAKAVKGLVKDLDRSSFFFLKFWCVGVLWVNTGVIIDHLRDPGVTRKTMMINIVAKTLVSTGSLFTAYLVSALAVKLLANTIFR